MTRCLTAVELQAVADNEADGATREHALECPSCRARVEETRRQLAALGTLTDGLPGPSRDLEQRVQQALYTRRVSSLGGRGATTMRRNAASAGGWRRNAWVSGLAAAAMIVLVVFVVWPGVSRESHLSAAEILGRSLQTFSTTSGVETLEYDLQLDGLANRALLLDESTGAIRITQVIDHDHPGRFRVVRAGTGTNSRVLSILVQDPDRGTRAGRFAVDGQSYYFRFTAPPERARAFVSLPDLQREQLRALVSVMQTTADQKLATVDDPTGTYYLIQVPPTPSTDSASASPDEASSGRGTTMWDLREAHALIHAGDFHLKELSARGTFLGQQFGLTFTLVRHEMTPSNEVSADDFTLQPQPDDIVLEGEATSDAPGDVVLAALRALAKTKH